MPREFRIDSQAEAFGWLDDATRHDSGMHTIGLWPEFTNDLIGRIEAVSPVVEPNEDGFLNVFECGLVPVVKMSSGESLVVSHINPSSHDVLYAAATPDSNQEGRFNYGHGIKGSMRPPFGGYHDWDPTAVVSGIHPGLSEASKEILHAWDKMEADNPQVAAVRDILFQKDMPNQPWVNMMKGDPEIALDNFCSWSIRANTAPQAEPRS